jgi:antitoxin VapB
VIPERHVKLFKNGQNQAVRIPREFELPGEDAIMREEGDRLIIEPGRSVRHLCIKISAYPVGQPGIPRPGDQLRFPGYFPVSGFTSRFREAKFPVPSAAGRA